MKTIYVLFSCISVRLMSLLFDHPVWFGLVFVVVLLLIWKWWMYTKKYLAFPTYPFLSLLFYHTAIKKNPKKLPGTSIFLQLLTYPLQRFQKEGMYLIWTLKPFLVIFGEEAVRVFSNHQAVLDKPYIYDILQDALGPGVATIRNAESWRKRRKLLNPLFNIRVIKDKLAIMNEHSVLLTKKLNGVTDKTSISITEYLKPCAFNIMCESIMGLQMDSPEDKVKMKTMIELVDKFNELTTFRISYPWLHFKFLLYFLPSGRKCLKLYKEIDIIVKTVVSELKKNFRKSDEVNLDDSDDTGKSLPHFLAEHHLKDPSFTMTDLQAELTTFLAAGYETVTYTCLWCLYLLGLHPEIQKQVYDEIQTVEGEFITYSDLQNLDYLKCVIQESMRLYPPVPVYGRCTNKDIQCGKYEVPQGTNILFSPYMLHRNPDIYSDPEKFDPDRFLPGTLEKRPWIYTPFSEGIRYCIGKNFAMMEIKVILVHILRKFKITSLDKREDIDLNWKIVLTPLRPLRMNLTPREQ